MSANIIPVAREFAGEEDVAPLAALLRDVYDKDRGGLTFSTEDLRFEWVDDEPGWIRKLQVWEAGDRFVADVGAWHEPGDQLNRAYGQIDVHPDWREPVFVDEVIAASAEAVAELIDRPVEHRLGGGATQDWKRAGLERAGYVLDRYYNRMIAPVSSSTPEPTPSAGFTIRPFAGEQEIEDWVRVFNAGFAEHHDPPTTTVIEKRHRMTEAGYIAAADLVLIGPEGHMIGIGRNSREIVDSGDDRGWVNSIIVLPDYRGRGLGRALLLASMRALHADGFERVVLTVDSGNETGALQLYTSVGFTLDHQFLQFMRPIDPVAS